METNRNPRISELFDKLYSLSVPVMVGLMYSEILNPAIDIILDYLKKCVGEININNDKVYFYTKWNEYSDFIYKDFIHYHFYERIDTEGKTKIPKKISLIQKSINDIECDNSASQNEFDIFYDKSFQDFLEKIKKIKKVWEDKCDGEFTDRNEKPLNDSVITLDDDEEEEQLKHILS